MNFRGEKHYIVMRIGTDLHTMYILKLGTKCTATMQEVNHQSDAQQTWRDGSILEQ